MPVTGSSCLLGHSSSIASERLAEERGGLGDRGARRPGLAECIEQHEVVAGPVVANGRDRDARQAELGRVRLTLVAEHVGLIDEQQGGWQSLQLLDCGLVGRRGDLRPLRWVSDVGVPEPLHRFAGEPGPVGELVIGGRVHRRIGDG